MRVQTAPEWRQPSSPLTGQAAQRLDTPLQGSRHREARGISSSLSKEKTQKGETSVQGQADHFAFCVKTHKTPLG